MLGEACLNIDSASQNNLAAEGGILRSNLRKQILNFFSYYGPALNNLTETRALLDGIVFCKLDGIIHFQIHSDSNLVIKWFYREYEIPWPL